MKSNIKLGMRYILLMFIMYLAYSVTNAEYLVTVKDVDPMILNITVGSIFASLTFVLKEHFNTTISKD